MANRSLGSLTLNLVADIGGYVGPLSRAERATAASAARMKKDIESVAKAGTVFAVGVGTAFTALVKHSIDLQDEMSKASQKIGVSVGDLSKLNYAADLSGVSFESLVGALGKFNRSLAEAAATGKGSAADALKDLGIEAKDTNGRLKNTNDVFLEVAERLSGLKDDALKTSLAMDLFGKSGADLIPLLNSGKTGLAEMADEAQKLGQVLDSESARKAEEFNDNLTRLQKTFSGVANAVAIEALPKLTEFSEKIKDPAFQDGIAKLASGLVSIATNVIRTAGYFGQFGSFLGEEFAAEINGISGEDIPRLTKRLEELNASLKPSSISDALFTAVPLEYITKSTAAREKERDVILQQLDAYKKYQIEQYKTLKNKPANTQADDGDPFALTPEQRAAEINLNRKLRDDREQAAKEAADQAKQLQKTFADSLANLQREIDLYNQVSKTAELRYETEKGNLKNLSEAQKEQLLNLAKIADMRERDQALLESQRAVDLAAMGDSGQLESVQYEYDLKKGIIQLNDTINGQDREKLINNKKLVEQLGQQAQIADLIKQQQRSIDLAGQTSKAAQTEYDIRKGILKVYGGINSEQAKVLIDQAKILDSQEKFAEAGKLSEKAFERIEEAGANIWVNLDDGFKDFRDSVFDSFKRLLAEMAHEAITKPILLQIQQQFTGGSGGANTAANAAQGAVFSPGGIYAAAALVTISAIGKWNDRQDAKFLKMTSDFKQANQSLSKVIGQTNAKSQSIADSIKTLSSVNDDVLNVNYNMLRALLDIRSGIEKVAAGFSKTLIGSSDYAAAGVKTGTTDLGGGGEFLAAGILGGGIGLVVKGIGDFIGGDVGGFVNNILSGASKALYNKKKKVIDSGIAITAETLGNILNGGVLQAKNYADVKTTKKVLGITTSAKVKRSTEDLDAVFEEQFSDVFRNAGVALKEASAVFGINFDDYVNQLQIKAQDLSLKGLEGDDLAKEIESFFGSTLDSWAETLLGGTEIAVQGVAGPLSEFANKLGVDFKGVSFTFKIGSKILEDFQQVGESAFETMIRLATETKTFSQYAKILELNFKAVGVESVYATQAIAEAAGGFDKLSASLAIYYDKFFSESDKFTQNQKSLTDAFKQLNVSLPETREGFKTLISGLDLSNEADQERFAKLIELSAATDQYFNALEKETDAKKAAAKQAEETAEAARQVLKDSAGKAFDNLAKAVDKQKDAVQKQIDAANNALNSTRAVTDSLNSALKSMTLQSSKNELATRRQAQAQIIAANAIAKAGGPLPKAGQLDDALSLLTQPSQDLYASFEDYARDFYITSKNIKELADATGEQQTYEEKNIETLTAQLSALDDLVKFYQTQIDKLNDVNTSVLSVRTAIDQLNNTLTDAGVDVTTPMALPELTYTYEKSQLAQSQDYTANTQTLATTSVDELILRIDTLTEQLEASQFAIAKNTLNSAKILQRWDADGMPVETVS